MSNKQHKSDIRLLIEYIVQSIVREIDTAKNKLEKKRWTVTLKENTITESINPKFVYPTDFKSARNYIRIARKPSTNEYIVLWYEEGTLNEDKSYFTDSIKDAWNTFNQLKIQVDNANSGAIRHGVQQPSYFTENDDSTQSTKRFVNRGEVHLGGGLDFETASKIASFHWDVFGYDSDIHGVWHFKTRGDRYCCTVGTLNGQPAILSVTTTPGRLELLVGKDTYPFSELQEKNQSIKKVDPHHSLKEMTTTSGGGGSSAGTPGYNIPGAFSGDDLEKCKKHIEVLGYTLTPQGKAEMKRAGDKLDEGIMPTKKCQQCGSLMPESSTRCPTCKFLNDDTPEHKKLKLGPLQEGASDASFSRAQRQYDSQLPPTSEGLECPECHRSNGFYTQREKRGRFYSWSAECPDCHAQWSDDNLDSD